MNFLIQHVVADWDEYRDSHSGRKFYRNRVTGEKSWKPPRRPKFAAHSDSGHEEESDLPTTPSAVQAGASSSAEEPSSPQPAPQPAVPAAEVIERSNADAFFYASALKGEA